MVTARIGDEEYPEPMASTESFVEVTLHRVPAMRIATLLVIDRQPPAAGTWGEQTLSLPGVLLPAAIPGTVGLGAFIEVEVDPLVPRV
jgi:hypothetical protein